jgi:asparagine synthetase B (glutamine-hydrolysing)
MAALVACFGDRAHECLTQMQRALAHLGRPVESYQGAGIAASRISDSTAGNGRNIASGGRASRPVAFLLADGFIMPAFSFPQKRQEGQPEDLIDPSLFDGSFVVLSVAGKTARVFRDPIGAKACYYFSSPDRRCLLISTHIKPILAVLDYAHGPNCSALGEILVFGQPLGSHTLVSGVNPVPPGHYLEVDIADDPPQWRIRRYHAFSEAPTRDWSLEEAVAACAQTLRSTLQSIVDTGWSLALALSGGLDSGILAHLLSETALQFLCVTAYAERDEPDLRVASAVCRAVGARQVEAQLTLDQYFENAADLIWMEETHSRLASMPFFATCRAAQSASRVLIAGEGPDDLFSSTETPRTWRGHLGYMRDTMRRLLDTAFALSDVAAGIVDELLECRCYSEYCNRLFSQYTRHHAAAFCGIELWDKIATELGLSLANPYLSRRFVDLVCLFPATLRITEDLGIDKHVLRLLGLQGIARVCPEVVLRSKRGYPAASGGLLAQFGRVCSTAVGVKELGEPDVNLFQSYPGEMCLYKVFKEIVLKGRGARPKPGFVRDFLIANGATM